LRSLGTKLHACQLAGTK